MISSGRTTQNRHFDRILLEELCYISHPKKPSQKVVGCRGVGKGSGVGGVGQPPKMGAKFYTFSI